MSLREVFPRFGFGYMLFGMVLIMVVSATDHETVSPMLVRLSVSLLLIASVYLLSHNRAMFLRVGIVLGLPTLLSTWLVMVRPSSLFLFIDYLTSAIFFLYVVYAVIRIIFSSTEITRDTLMGSVCIYLLLGFVWAFVFGALETIAPQSFKGLDAAEIGSMVYFSFVTLSTLGYGDITPITRPAELLAVLEAIIGQFYLAILVARLMGMYKPKSKVFKKL
ncbi:potassium channel family protein [Aestuariirhabdus sp. Z084]|uniref:potassium channel family protein n=1 Tax=Aestuariirhabdus haliotis TaxID=2918751 RepID=UPI00201B456E|nr:potassium channel family protein [Aestuariirhabdus haliotis]MCL6417315.1 potassium channel family protein [Aestuariirhabdus haliotis]MCL6421260.1 potassium channel family protein [Aestuariirhabdus haliotis]